MTSVRGRILCVTVGIGAALAASAFSPDSARAALTYDQSIKAEDPGDLDQVIGKLLDERTNDRLFSARFRFFKTPPPASDGILTVIAAGDLGIGLDENAAVVEEDFLRVFGEDPQQGVIDLLFDTTERALDPNVPPTPRLLIRDPATGEVLRKAETLGFLIKVVEVRDADGNLVQEERFVDKDGNVLADQNDITKRVFVGPNYHNAIGEDGKNAIGEEGHKDIPALDRITIPRDILAKLAEDGMITFTFQPNDFPGLGSLKYVDAEVDNRVFAVRLTYTPAPTFPALPRRGYQSLAHERYAVSCTYIAPAVVKSRPRGFF